jgi:multiple sugar transport system permease protein
VLLGLGLAIVVNRLGFGASIIRTLLLVPLLVPGIVVSLMWKILLDPLDGVVNWALGAVGLPKPLWLGSADTVIPGIVLIDTWWQTAFVFIILAAALKSLPDEPLEAAKVDGANGWQTFWHVTLPLLRPALLTVIIFRTIDTLKVFDIIFGTTGGGPNRASEAAQTLAYRTAFDFLEMSRSMTVMVVFSAVILVICIIYVTFGERDS